VDLSHLLSVPSQGSLTAGGGQKLRSGALLEPIAVVAGLDYLAAVGEAIEQRRSHLGIPEHTAPFSEGEVGGHEERDALVELAEQVEQQRATVLGKGYGVVNFGRRLHPFPGQNCTPVNMGAPEFVHICLLVRMVYAEDLRSNAPIDLSTFFATCDFNGVRDSDVRQPGIGHQQVSKTKPMEGSYEQSGRFSKSELIHTTIELSAAFLTESDAGHASGWTNILS
jgi:hypothetical protein